MREIGRNACVTCGEKWVAHVAAASEGALLLLRLVEQRLGARRQRQVSLGEELLSHEVREELKLCRREVRLLLE